MLRSDERGRDSFDATWDGSLRARLPAGAATMGDAGGGG